MALTLTDAHNSAAHHSHLEALRAFATAFLLAVLPSKSQGAQAVPALVASAPSDFVDIDVDEQPTIWAVHRIDT